MLAVAEVFFAQYFLEIEDLKFDVLKLEEHIFTAVSYS